MMVFVSNSRRVRYSGRLAFALGRIGIEEREAPSSPATASWRRCSSMVTPAGIGKSRQIVLAERNVEVATLRDRHAVGERFGQVGEALRHLGLRLEVLLRRKALRPPLIGQHVAFGDAHPRLVRAEFVAGEKLHRVRGDDRQRRRSRQDARSRRSARRRRRGRRAAPRDSSDRETASPTSARPRSLPRRCLAASACPTSPSRNPGERDQTRRSLRRTSRASARRARDADSCDRRG